MAAVIIRLASSDRTDILLEKTNRTLERMAPDLKRLNNPSLFGQIPRISILRRSRQPRLLILSLMRNSDDTRYAATYLTTIKHENCGGGIVADG